VALGRTLVERKKPAAARGILKPIAQKAPASFRGQAQYQLARCCLLEAKAEAALKHLNAAEKLDAESLHKVEGQELRGQAYQKLGRVKEAIGAYREALKLDSQSKAILAILIELELAGKDPRQALDDLRRYTVLAGADAAEQCTAAGFYLRLGRTEDALDLALRAHESKPTAATERILGLIHLQRGAFPEAIAHLAKTEQDEKVLEGQIRSQLMLGKLSEAERLILEADFLPGPTPGLDPARALVRTLGKRRAALQSELAIPQERTERFTAALDCLVCAEEAHTQGRPRTQVEKLLAGAFADEMRIGPAYALRGLLALEQGQVRKARADAEQAVKLSARDPGGYYLRGRVRLECGEDGAVADLTRAAELSQRQDARLLHSLAAALLRSGSLDNALRVQQDAVKLKPGDTELAEQLREIEKAVKRATARPASPAGRD
jgi:tetratricopeptide (TPR) repeat protein